MDVDAAEFQDWEMLQSNPDSDSESLTPAGIDEIGSEPGGLIQVDYFSVDSQSKSVTTFTAATDGSEDISEESDNPSWIDPGSENRFTMKNPGEFWSDSGSDRSEIRQSVEFKEVSFEGIEEMSSENGKLGDLGENEKIEGEKRDEVIEKAEEQKRSIVWWKLPREILKYCAFRFSPMWTFSMAAALMGFAILGRRLYKMKKKAKSLELKVTVDDKKVSQFMNRAARLNEAFSVVKRIPVIRPQLPALGVAPWPVVSLR